MCLRGVLNALISLEYYIFSIFQETNFWFYDSGVMSVFYNILKFLFLGLLFIL